MSGQAPTSGQVKASHAIVGVAGGLAVHEATSEMRMTPLSRVVLFAFSGTISAYLHHKADAPVAKFIAKIA
jgi:hypothetical protein